MKLNDLGDLKGLAKEMKKEEKRKEEERLRALEEERKRARSLEESYFPSSLSTSSGKKSPSPKSAPKGPARHEVLPDGSNATVEDYFPSSDAFINDKFDDPFSEESRRGSKAASKYIEVDLHITALSPPPSLPKNKYLEYQMGVFRRTMEENQGRRGRKIIFIHGVGDGILRRAIINELDEVYYKCQYQDAPFHKYGMGGALLVTIA